MRLTSEQREVIRQTVLAEIPGAEPYAFGSRVHDDAKGGDIDILVVGEDTLEVARLLRLRIVLKDRLGDQKIDLIYESRNSLSLFAQTVLLEAQPV